MTWNIRFHCPANQASIHMPLYWHWWIKTDLCDIFAQVRMTTDDINPWVQQHSEHANTSLTYRHVDGLWEWFWTVSEWGFFYLWMSALGLWMSVFELWASGFGLWMSVFELWMSVFTVSEWFWTVNLCFWTVNDCFWLWMSVFRLWVFLNCQWVVLGYKWAVLHCASVCFTIVVLHTCWSDQENM